MKVFVIAMEKEALPVIGAMHAERDFIFCGKRVLCGTLYGKRAGIVVCGVGKVNAACGTQIAVDELGADEIINVGVAGGLHANLAVGEIYGISEVVQYDFDLTQINNTAIGTLDECKNNYLPLSTQLFPLKRLATGDRFNDSKEDYSLLTKTLGADIRDMEGGAIAQTCMHAGVKFKAYKIISDIAGNASTTEQYLKNLDICLKTLEEQLKNIVEA